MNRNSLHSTPHHTTAPRQLWSQLRMTLCVPSIRRRQWCWCSWISPQHSTLNYRSQYPAKSTSQTLWNYGNCSELVWEISHRSLSSNLTEWRKFWWDAASMWCPTMVSYLLLGEIARRHGVELHLYADDTQVYMSFSPLSDENTTKTFQSTEGCIAEIRTWLKDNKLMLNDDKKMYL